MFFPSPLLFVHIAFAFLNHFVHACRQSLPNSLFFCGCLVFGRRAAFLSCDRERSSTLHFREQAVHLPFQVAEVTVELSEERFTCGGSFYMLSPRRREWRQVVPV